MAEEIAFLCPGQGAQHVGMGADLIAEFPQVGEVFAEADDVLGFSLSNLCAEGPEDELMQTENAQPALLSMSVAIARTLETEAGLVPTIAAGHSLGEWSALVVAGSLELADALRAVRQRGLFSVRLCLAGRAACRRFSELSPRLLPSSARRQRLARPVSSGLRIGTGGGRWWLPGMWRRWIVSRLPPVTRRSGRRA